MQYLNLLWCETSHETCTTPGTWSLGCIHYISSEDFHRAPFCCDPSGRKKTKRWWIPKKILWNKTIHWWIPQKMFRSIMVINDRYILSWVLWLLYMRHKYSAHMEYFKSSCGFHIAMTSTHGPLEILNEIVIDGPCISCKRGLMRLSLDLTDN